MDNLDKDIIDLVMVRLESLPDDYTVSVGSHGEFTKDELLNSVKRGDEVGRAMIDMEMSFLRALKDGTLYGTDIVGNTT